MSDLNLDDLTNIFPSDFPSIFINIARNTKESNPLDFEAFEETEKFRKRRWAEVDSYLLKECYDIPFLFSPVAFHYYFPSFILCSYGNFSDVELLVGSVVRLLHPASNAEWIKWRKERWDLFNESQWQAIQKWLDYIEKAHSDKIDIKDLELARKGLIEIWSCSLARGAD